MLTKLLLIGAGGHAKVVTDAVYTIAPDCQIFIRDQDPCKMGKILINSIKIELLQNWSDLPEKYHVCIGNNHHRRTLDLTARTQGKQPYTVIHSEAYVSPYAQIAPGCFIAAKSVVSAGVRMTEGCIINHSAIVDHDCKIGAFTHIAPNVTLGGGVEIGAGSLIGASATVLPGIKLGENVVIGAGAVILSDVPDNQKVVGVPGRYIGINE